MVDSSQENTDVMFNVHGDDIYYLVTIEDSPKNLRLNQHLKSKIAEIFPGNYNYFVKTKFGDKYDIHYSWSWSTN